MLEAEFGDDPLGVFWDFSKIKSCPNRIIFITKTYHLKKTSWCIM